jgi:hypothetical protein
MFSDRNYARRLKAKALREQAAQLAFDRSHPERIPNGEEEAFGYLTNFHKGLPHNHLGEVEHSAYRALLTSLTSGDPNDFENIPLQSFPENDGRKLVNPQCGLALDLEGPDSQSMMIPPAPRIDGAENSGEMGELYWMALMRDCSGLMEPDTSKRDNMIINRGVYEQEKNVQKLFSGVQRGGSRTGH